MSFPYGNGTPRRSIRLAEKAWKENFFAATQRVKANYTAIKNASDPFENVRATLEFLNGLISTDRIVLPHPLTRSKFREMFDVLPQRHYVMYSDLIVRTCMHAHRVMDEEIQIQEQMIADYAVWRAQGLVV